jgi:hypothetical protein
VAIRGAWRRLIWLRRATNAAATSVHTLAAIDVIWAYCDPGHASLLSEVLKMIYQSFLAALELI